MDPPEAEPEVAASVEPRAPTPHSGLPLNERIDWIRAQYGAIQTEVASGTWHSVRIDATHLALSGLGRSQIELYCDPAGAPQKMVLGLERELGRLEHEVFVYQHTPFFGLRTDIGIDRPGKQVTYRDEHRFYYDGATVIRVIGPDQRSQNNPTGRSAQLAQSLHADVMTILSQPNICSD